MNRDYDFLTRSVHAGEAADPTTGAHGVPIYQNTTYGFRSYDELAAYRQGQRPHFVYARDGNPTVRSLEVKLAALEGAEDAVACASGMAAISATLLHLLGDGGHLVASDDIYAVARDLLLDDLPRAGARVTFCDTASPEAVEAALETDTRALYVETLSNPLLRVADLDALVTIAGRRGIPLVVDNTFLSPALLRPLEHGASLVLHSATKYLSGHGHVLGGVVCGPRTLVGPIRRLLSHLGGAMGAFEAFLLLAGVKTLPLRMAQHCANADRLARLLDAHPAVAAVHWPGLPAHPGHAAAERLTAGRHGGVLSFRLHGGVPVLRAFLDALELGTLAVSLGECSTLVWPFEEEGVVRLAVGIEATADLEADLTRALAAAAAELVALPAPVAALGAASATSGPPPAGYVSAVGAHYAPGGLTAAIRDALQTAGKDTASLRREDLAPVDQFHLGGEAATRELAARAGLAPGQRVLDVGGGLGGPARTLAAAHGCGVTVLDLTAEFCQTGAQLTAWTGLTDRVAFVHGDALALPFPDGCFDLVLTQHSTMNIPDKEHLFRELYRVLRPGGRLALHEILAGPRQPVRYPVTWARTPGLSFLSSPARLRPLLRSIGFAQRSWRDVTGPTRAAVLAPQQGAVPPPSPLGMHLLLGTDTAERQGNLVCNLSEGRIAVVQAVFERPVEEVVARAG
jgi:methionine-gamma-lyase